MVAYLLAVDRQQPDFVPRRESQVHRISVKSAWGMKKH
jgi:hypothetical protein